MENHTSPQWLETMLGGDFYSVCELHCRDPRNPKPAEYRNTFCLDCLCDAFCPACAADHHNHETFQLFRASNETAIRVEAIREYIDVSNICEYIVNHKAILFLNKRTQYGNRKGIIICEVCERDIREGRFCCIRCKLEAMKRGGRGATLGINTGHIQKRKAHAVDLKAKTLQGFRKRSRKGIPYRSPFW